jgi:HAD superfamily hydrolase (TIGR01509 family)
MKIRAIIFDMDGVISDTQTLAANVESKILKRYGIDMSPGYLTATYAGTKHKYMYEKEFSSRKMNIDVDTVVDETWNEILSSENLITPIDGIYELITMLKKQDYKLAVASGSRKEFIKIVLKKLELTDTFNITASSDEVANGKPSPDLFLMVAKKLHVKPEECIVIEDGTNGMIAAKSAGMKCIGLVSDAGKYPADITVKSLKDIDISLLHRLEN